MSRFELAKDKQQCSQEACDLLLLSLYTHLPPSRGLEVRTMELVLESVLKVVFQQVHYRDRNFALIKKEGGIMLQLGRFTKAKHTGHETISATDWKQGHKLWTKALFCNLGIFPEVGHHHY